MWPVLLGLPALTSTVVRGQVGLQLLALLCGLGACLLRGQRGDVNSARGGLHYLLSRPTYGGIAEPRRAHRGLQPEVDLDGQRFADGGNLGRR